MTARQQWQPLEYAREVFDRALVDVELLVIEHADGIGRPTERLRRLIEHEHEHEYEHEHEHEHEPNSQPE